MSKDKVVLLPGHSRPPGSLDPLADPNLSKNFSSAEIDSVWGKLERLVVDEVSQLLLKHTPNLREQLGEQDFKIYVAGIAAFFLSGSADRIVIAPHIKGAAPFADL